jgi:hypothetical protein
MTATEILKTRVTPEMKSRVVEIARAELLTEALLQRHHIRMSASMPALHHAL